MCAHAARDITAVRNGAIRLHIIDPHQHVLGVINIQQPLVGRKSEPVRCCEINDDRLYILAIRANAIYPLPAQLGRSAVALVGRVIAAYMILMGGGSGLFTSPNVNALMSTVPPRQRGTASGINTMVTNTGQMLAITIAFPLVLSRIPQDVMFKVFLYGGGMGDMPAAWYSR